MAMMRRNGRILLFFGLLFGGVLAIGAAFSGSLLVAAGSWGLCFQDEGEPPVGNTSQTVLRVYQAAYLGDPDEPVIYLTFDAGYENGCTAQILDVLQAHQVPATFFLVGNYLEQNPELVRRMADEGHTVGNHTWSHGDMSSIADPADFRSELERVEAAYEATTGREMEKYYRPPRGIYNEANLAMARELGYRTVFWSLAYVDWERDDQPTAEEAFAKLLPRIHNGAVVLLHSTSTTNAAILDELLTRWEEMGYTFAPISQLFADFDSPAGTNSGDTHIME